MRILVTFPSSRTGKGRSNEHSDGDEPSIRALSGPRLYAWKPWISSWMKYHLWLMEDLTEGWLKCSTYSLPCNCPQLTCFTHPSMQTWVFGLGKWSSATHLWTNTAWKGWRTKLSSLCSENGLHEISALGSTGFPRIFSSGGGDSHRLLFWGSDQFG